MFVLAYFDPGSASLLMQALVGGGAGLIVFGRYLWMSLTGLGPKLPASTTVSMSHPQLHELRGMDEQTLSEALSGEFRFHAS